MTETTSSAASDTDRARNRGTGAAGAGSEPGPAEVVSAEAVPAAARTRRVSSAPRAPPAVAPPRGRDGACPPPPVGRHGGGVKAPAPVPYEQRHPVGLHLQVHVDGVDPGVAGGVEGRLPAGGDQRPSGVIEGGV